MYRAIRRLVRSVSPVNINIPIALLRPHIAYVYIWSSVGVGDDTSRSHALPAVFRYIALARAHVRLSHCYHNDVPDVGSLYRCPNIVLSMADLSRVTASLSSISRAYNARPRRALVLNGTLEKNRATESKM